MKLHRFVASLPALLLFQCCTDKEHNMKPQLIWYASYGSNLNEQRFYCYIEGGTPPGSTTQSRQP